MRVLLTTKRGAGHFGPLIPFARAFRRAGATVLVAAPRSAAPMVHAEGFAAWVFDDAPDEGRDPVFAAAMATQAPAGYVFAEAFARIDARAALPGMLDICRRWRPDLVISEITEFAGPMVAAKLGIPAISVGISQQGRSEAVAAASEVLPALDELGELIGLPPDPDGERILGLPYFTLVPEALEEPALRSARAAWRFRDRDDAPAALATGRFAAKDHRPLVYVTFGSVAPTMDLFPGVYRGAIDAFSALPVRVLVTIGRDRDPDELGPVPDNVRVEGWVPQREVMPYASAMVCHGGSGTVTMGLAAGVPMAVVPLFADQSWNAERIDTIGVGIALDGGPQAVSRLGDAVSKLLIDPAYRTNAERAADEIGLLPTVDAAPAVARALAEERTLAAIA
jgi:UDP:flavonoid glycosyltransferase YjiC (YdhE family)